MVNWSDLDITRRDRDENVHYGGIAGWRDGIKGTGVGLGKDLGKSILDPL